jgi:ABC-type bacteriocin/lantibiotic exporter with double-glycine peptidase domain
VRRGLAVKVVEQRHDYDCGTACLSMLLEVPYGDAAAAVRAVTDPKRDGGTDTRELQRAARHLGAALRCVRRRKDFLAGQTGILGIMPDTDKSELPVGGHWTIFKRGVIVDTDGTVWPSATDYFRTKRARPVTLLVRV